MLLRSMFVLGALFITSAPAFADQVIFEDGPNQIILETATRDYLVRYVGDDGTLKTIRWTPPTNIDASVQSRFKLAGNDAVRYTYTIQNNKSSPQSIVSAKVLVGAADEKAVAAPDSWEIDVVKNYKEGATDYWIHWSQYRTGLPSGQRQGGYAVVKSDLPGMGHLWLRGASSMIGFSDEGPRGKMVHYLEGDFFFAHIDGVPHVAATPRIPIPAPFNAVVVLGGIQKHVQDDMASMQLIDPALLGLIDRGLTQAIAAAQIGNTSSLLHEIKNLRKLLKQEHADVDQDNDGDDDDKEKQPKPRIAKLAAKVLDFDLKYIEKRTKGDKD